MIGIAFHGGDDFVHLVQDLQPLAAVHVALEKLEHIQAIARVLHEGGEKDVQAVVEGDELVPVLDAVADHSLVLGEAGLAEVVVPDRSDDVLAGNACAVQGHAHTA